MFYFDKHRLCGDVQKPSFVDVFGLGLSYQVIFVMMYGEHWKLETIEGCCTCLHPQLDNYIASEFNLSSAISWKQYRTYPWCTIGPVEMCILPEE